MKAYMKKVLCLLAVVLFASMLLVSCDDDDDEGSPRNGAIQNRTPYQVRINFSGIKIIEVPANSVVGESSLEEGKTYQIQTTILDSAGNALEVINTSAYIDKDADDRTINNDTYSWFIRIWGDSVPFTVESAS